MKDHISFRGDKKTWLEFSIKLKREKKQVWEVLEPMLKNFSKTNKRCEK
jgi:hypothetical protein